MRNRNLCPISHMNRKRNKRLFALRLAEVLECHSCKNRRSEIAIKLLVSIVSILLPVVNAHATSEDEAFQKIAKDYVEEMLRTHPEYATELGDHRFDGELTDYSAETRARALTTNRQFREKLERFNDISKLTGANQVDVRILRENIDGDIFDLDEMKDAEWNPLVYNQSLANGLYLLVAR